MSHLISPDAVEAAGGDWRNVDNCWRAELYGWAPDNFWTYRHPADVILSAEIDGQIVRQYYSNLAALPRRDDHQSALAKLVNPAYAQVFAGKLTGFEEDSYHWPVERLHCRVPIRARGDLTWPEYVAAVLQRVTKWLALHEREEALLDYRVLEKEGAPSRIVWPNVLVAHFRVRQICDRACADIDARFTNDTPDSRAAKSEEARAALRDGKPCRVQLFGYRCVHPAQIESPLEYSILPSAAQVAEAYNYARGGDVLFAPYLVPRNRLAYEAVLKEVVANHSLPVDGGACDLRNGNRPEWVGWLERRNEGPIQTHGEWELVATCRGGAIYQSVVLHRRTRVRYLPWDGLAGHEMLMPRAMVDIVRLNRAVANGEDVTTSRWNWEANPDDATFLDTFQMGRRKRDDTCSTDAEAPMLPVPAPAAIRVTSLMKVPIEYLECPLGALVVRDGPEGDIPRVVQVAEYAQTFAGALEEAGGEWRVLEQPAGGVTVQVDEVPRFRPLAEVLAEVGAVNFADERYIVPMSGGCGSGKTHTVIEYARGVLEADEDARVLFVFPLCSLIEDVSQRLGAEPHCRYNDEPDIIRSSRWVLTTLHSLPKVLKTMHPIAFTHVFVDEARTCRAQMSNSTTRNRRMRINAALGAIVRKARVAIIADAFMSNADMGFLPQLRSVEVEAAARFPDHRVNTYLPLANEAFSSVLAQQRRVFVSFAGNEVQNSLIIARLVRGERVAVFCASRTRALQLWAAVRTASVIGDDDWMLVDRDTSPNDRRQIVRLLVERPVPVRLFIYTPAINVGVDITLPPERQFHRLFACTSTQQSVGTQHQAIERVRDWNGPCWLFVRNVGGDANLLDAIERQGGAEFDTGIPSTPDASLETLLRDVRDRCDQRLGLRLQMAAEAEVNMGSFVNDVEDVPMTSLTLTHLLNYATDMKLQGHCAGLFVTRLVNAGYRVRYVDKAAIVGVLGQDLQELEEERLPFQPRDYIQARFDDVFAGEKGVTTIVGGGGMTAFDRDGLEDVGVPMYQLPSNSSALAFIRELGGAERTHLLMRVLWYWRRLVETDYDAAAVRDEMADRVRTHSAREIRLPENDDERQRLRQLEDPAQDEPARQMEQEPNAFMLAVLLYRLSATHGHEEGVFAPTEEPLEAPADDEEPEVAETLGIDELNAELAALDWPKRLPKNAANVVEAFNKAVFGLKLTVATRPRQRDANGHQSRDRVYHYSDEHRQRRMLLGLFAYYYAPYLPEDDALVAAYGDVWEEVAASDVQSLAQPDPVFGAEVERLGDTDQVERMREKICQRARKRRRARAEEEGEAMSSASE